MAQCKKCESWLRPSGQCNCKMYLIHDDLNGDDLEFWSIAHDLCAVAADYAERHFGQYDFRMEWNISINGEKYEVEVRPEPAFYGHKVKLK